jgi:hypothetical protein
VFQSWVHLGPFFFFSLSSRTGPTNGSAGEFFKDFLGPTNGSVGEFFKDFFCFFHFHFFTTF